MMAKTIPTTIANTKEYSIRALPDLWRQSTRNMSSRLNTCSRAITHHPTTGDPAPLREL